MVTNDLIRNIAIIAHVDHGKTTLVDAMFRQSGTFREGQEIVDRLMDSMDLERERGITIAAKNCSIHWRGIKINIIDTPGHADFGGEVERALSMADSALLLVDASEGPLPQTRFVLQKALIAKLKIIVVINKIDRQDARPEAVLDEIYDLFIDLGADEEQLEFPLLYAIGRQGIVKKKITDESTHLHILFDTIVDRAPPPTYDPEAPFQMLVTDLGFSEYLGRLAIGRVVNGHIRTKSNLVRIGEDSQTEPLRVTRLQSWEGPGCIDADEVGPGDLIVLAGIEEVHIGDTICHQDRAVALPRIVVDEPTVAMEFRVNDSPMRGKEGKFVQGNKIYDRLVRETLHNVALRVEATSAPDVFIVKGRGELQMAILIETMRREGFELTVGRPRVILKDGANGMEEPIEHLYVDCEEVYVGIVTEKLSMRKGRMVNLTNHGTGRVRLEFTIPSRGLIGYRDEFLSDTKGTGLLNSYLSGYEAYRGEFPTRYSGSIVSDRDGKAVPYALFNIEPRGLLFINPGEVVYEGMIIGSYNKDGDINVNPVKEKKLTNMRASGKDDAVTLAPVVPMTLERAINFIADDERVEVTPKSIRMRKVVLSAQLRHSARSRKYKEGLE